MSTKLFEGSFPVAPVPWQRATPVPGRMITAHETRVYEGQIKFLAKTMMGPRPPLDQPLKATLQFFLHRPHRYRNRPLCDVKPDLDNLEKSFLDACNKVIWIDDCRIVDMRKTKKWAVADGWVHLALFTVEDQ